MITTYEVLSCNGIRMYEARLKSNVPFSSTHAAEHELKRNLYVI